MWKSGLLVTKLGTCVADGYQLHHESSRHVSTKALPILAIVKEAPERSLKINSS